MFGGPSQDHMKRVGLKGFCHVVVSNTFHDGYTNSMQISGVTASVRTQERE